MNTRTTFSAKPLLRALHCVNAPRPKGRGFYRLCEEIASGRGDGEVVDDEVGHFLSSDPVTIYLQGI